MNVDWIMITPSCYNKLTMMCFVCELGPLSARYGFSNLVKS